MSPSDIRIFVSFDVDHDADLYERLLAESRERGSGLQGTARKAEADASAELARAAAAPRP